MGPVLQNGHNKLMFSLLKICLKLNQQIKLCLILDFESKNQGIKPYSPYSFYKTMSRNKKKEKKERNQGMTLVKTRFLKSQGAILVLSNNQGDYACDLWKYVQYSTVHSWV